jgi:hypothetical protein
VWRSKLFGGRTVSKFNSNKCVIDGYTFDSKVEGKYYEKLKEDKANGLIENFELQPSYVIIPKFELNGKKYRETKYVGDFLIEHNDGTYEVIDIKGWATETAKLKRKMFIAKYRQGIKLTWLKWYKGDWVEC